jgi:hypothetical protein
VATGAVEGVGCKSINQQVNQQARVVGSDGDGRRTSERSAGGRRGGMRSCRSHSRARRHRTRAVMANMSPEKQTRTATPPHHSLSPCDVCTSAHHQVVVRARQPRVRNKGASDRGLRKRVDRKTDRHTPTHRPTHQPGDGRGSCTLFLRWNFRWSSSQCDGTLGSARCGSKR